MHWLEALRGFEFTVDAVDFVRIERQQIGQRRHGGFLVHQPVGDNIDAKIRPVVGNGLAITVDKPTPARRNDRQVDSIAFGQQLVFFVIGDGNVGHPRGNRQADSRLHPADEHRAAGKSEIELS